MRCPQTAFVESGDRPAGHGADYLNHLNECSAAPEKIPELLGKYRNNAYRALQSWRGAAADRAIDYALAEYLVTYLRLVFLNSRTRSAAVVKPSRRTQESLPDPLRNVTGA